MTENKSLRLYDSLGEHIATSSSTVPVRVSIFTVTKESVLTFLRAFRKIAKSDY